MRRRDLIERSPVSKAIPPGETLRQLAADRGLSDYEMASKIALLPEDLIKLYNGYIMISEQLAEDLENTGFVSKEFWLEREEEYEQEIRREKIERISHIFTRYKRKDG